jgi:zinc D-Ala-D-Ala carboxypeptidase
MTAENAQSNQENERKPLFTAITIATIVLLIALGYGEYRRSTLARTVSTLGQEIASTTTSYESRIALLETRMSTTEAENAALIEALDEEREDSDSLRKAVRDQISKISSTVGSLDKLSKTDPELLQKYSKTYFLNEHYTPSKLDSIDRAFLLQPERALQFHDDALPFLEDMIRDAADDNINLKIVSAYRSFGTQASLKASYTVTYGAGTANQFSADQGYSEHQLGTAIDITTPELGNAFDGFDQTQAFSWMKDNAHKYGFVLSYPEKNAFYQYEPWHWRFVGVDLATKLKRQNKNFYDLDQREIDKYLLVIFN